jgi:DNA primase
MTTHSSSVAERATIADVLQLGGFAPPNNRGFMSCPLHSERSPSFHIVASGRGYHCFGCNAKGGVLDLVVALGIAPDAASAAKWLEAAL